MYFDNLSCYISLHVATNVALPSESNYYINHAFLIFLDVMKILSNKNRWKMEIDLIPHAHCIQNFKYRPFLDPEKSHAE